MSQMQRWSIVGGNERSAHHAVSPHDHTVQFYESEQYLSEAVTRFLADGLRKGNGVVVIATPEHHKIFAERLQAHRIEIESAVKTGQLNLFDGHQTLAEFMDSELPNPDRFASTIGSLIESSRVAREHLPVLAYGEMAAILWREGKCEAAVRLEELWNELASSHRFQLLCAYAMNGFYKEAHQTLFERICKTHSAVTPSERYVQLNEDGKWLEIALLQQRSLALDAERKRIEAERNQLLVREQTARAEAEAANRLKDDFLAVLSHELRTPLNVILGWTSILSTRKDEELLNHALEVIKRNAGMQRRLIEDLLDISRILTGKMIIKTEQVDLEAVINAALDSVRPAANLKGVQLNIQIDESARSITGDSDRLRQVIWNLLANSMKFTASGGHVDVHLQNGARDVQITVRDSGQGIPRKFLPFVFDRFRQAEQVTSRQHGGLGLGLAVVRHLVELHGGSVSADSPGEGLGASFVVRLPRGS
jgi:signal transduction histidine kinase